MSTALDLNIDRRNHPRTLINSEVKYKLSDDAAYSTGQLIDLSQTGALIQLEHALYLNTQLSLTVETNDEALEMILEVVRVADAVNYDQYTYGCVITDIIDFDLCQE